MEEKIFEIINQNFNGISECPHSCAREIAAYVKENYYKKEFAEWLIIQTRYKYNSKTKLWITNTVANFTWENIYQYWWDFIKDK